MAAAFPAGVPSASSASHCAAVTSALCVASSGTINTSLKPASKTLAAASGSAQMLNSADGVMFPTSWPPPMMISCGTHSANFGSWATAAAMFVSGPIGISVIGSVAVRYVSISHSTARFEAAARVLRGMSRYVPCGSCTESALKKRSAGIVFRTSGRGSPACTGISERPIRSNTEMLLVVVAVSGAFPNTVLTPIRSISG